MYLQEDRTLKPVKIILIKEEGVRKNDGGGENPWYNWYTLIKYNKIKYIPKTL
jgi:hypothetical protein